MKAHPLYYIPSSTQYLLDIGCGDGTNLLQAQKKGISKMDGVDIDNLELEKARKRFKNNPNVTLIHHCAQELPLNSNSFDAIICSHALEHFQPEQRPYILKEIHRVIVPQGVFILSVPSHGLFSFLDSADLRLKFPKIFNLISRLVGGNGTEKGVQLVDQKVNRHHHFSYKEILNLVEPYFKIEHIRHGGCFLSPICTSLEFPFQRYKKTHSSIYKFIQSIHRLDLSINWGKWGGYQVLLVLKPHNRPISE